MRIKNNFYVEAGNTLWNLDLKLEITKNEIRLVISEDPVATHIREVYLRCAVIRPESGIVCCASRLPDELQVDKRSISWLLFQLKIVHRLIDALLVIQIAKEPSFLSGRRRPASVGKTIRDFYSLAR